MLAVPVPCQWPGSVEKGSYLSGQDGRQLAFATNKLDEKFDASPAVVGKELFLRGHEYLYCVAEK